MKVLLSLILALCAMSTVAQAFDFRGARRWLAICVPSEVALAPFRAPSAVKDPSNTLHLVWDRGAGVAELAWNGGTRKVMRQINVDADNLVHFAYGPDTAKIYPGDGSENAGIDCCYNAMLSHQIVWRLCADNPSHFLWRCQGGKHDGGLHLPAAARGG